MEGTKAFEEVSKLLACVVGVRPETKKKTYEVLHQDLKGNYEIYPESLELLEEIEGQVSERLYTDIRESLRGFEADMQVEIMQDIEDFVYDNIARTTGIQHVDNLLMGFYGLIKEEQEHEKD